MSITKKPAALKKSKWSILEFHNPKNIHLYVGISIAVLLVVSLFIRKSLIHFSNADYEIFSSWYDYVKLHGISSFSTDFSNYNPPYTYFLYLITLLPVAKIVAIKGLMVVFDLLMAFGVYLVVKQVGRGRYVALFAGVASLFLPTVLANGVFWGQFDQFYTAFILFSLYYLLRNNSKLAWLYFGVAIAIKLQAIFFLPVLIIMSFNRIKLVDSLYAALSFIVLTALPIFAGRSIGSIVNIYAAQTGLFKGNLTLNAPNIYQWVPNSSFEFLNSAGIYLTFAVMAGFLIYSLIYKKYSNRDIMLLSAIMLFLVPFLLPQMHERYFFTATIASFLVVFTSPRLIWVAIVMQVTTLFSYVPFLFGQAPPVSFGILALAGLAMVCTLTYEYIRTDKLLSSKPNI